MERGSDKHGRLLDEALKSEVEGMLRSGHDTHAEEWKSAEPSGEDEPEVDRSPEATMTGGVPDGMTADDVEGRSELASYIGRSVYPAVREQLIEAVMDNSAPDRVVAEIKRLPSGRTFANINDVWTALGGHVEEHRS